jgi:outer membrane receptor protein involved in Fe transport
MTRSKQRKIRRRMQSDSVRPQLRRHSLVARALPLASAIIVCLSTAQAQEAASSGTLEEVVVTAQKRTESLQNVPLSITALGTQQLQDLHVQNFDDYIQYLPSVAIKTTGPGQDKVYMRGVASGGDGVHNGSAPSVGVYLDEQPVTIVQGVLDIHIYDIARVEALAGPQGTLYGASSEAGTLRIITNKPEFDVLKGAYDIQANDVAHGRPGYSAEGYINIPINSAAAIRLVGWYKKDGGYIDNVPGSLSYPATYANGAPGAGFTMNNGPTPSNPAPNTVYTGTAKNDYNDVETFGARAALRIALGDHWTITPTVQGQETTSHGVFAMEQTKSVPGYPGLYPALGDLEVQHFNPELQTDDWTQATLTVEGNISDFDLTYAGGYLHRSSTQVADYADYSLAYQIAYTRGPKYFTDNAGNAISPSQRFRNTDGYRMYSHELRVSTPVHFPVHATFGGFTELQNDAFIQNYSIANLADAQSVTDWPGTWYLTDQREIRRDFAGFGEVTWDATAHISLLGGLRYYTYHNSSQGFSGFKSFEAQCPDPTLRDQSGGPCQNRWLVARGSGVTPKYTATYKFDDQRLVYATVSKGFRPGGTNTFGPQYQSDTLQNYEVGWKTSWLGNTLRVNGAIFQEDWKNFQFTYPGQYGIFVTKNAGGARIRGIETSIDWAATNSLTFGGGVSWLNPILTVPYCKYSDPNGGVQTATCFNYASGTPVAEPYAAPAGQQLPVTPKFKGNLMARYNLSSVDGWQPHVQGSLVYESAVWADLRTAQRDDLGQQPAYALVDASIGAEKGGLGVELFVNNVFDRLAENYRYAECNATVCGAEAVYANVYKPRLIGMKFAQKF